MATKLFVAKLSFNTTNDSLQALFAGFGTVNNVHIATDRDTNQSRGFGFVEMENDSEAQQAIRELDGKTFEDRIIAVAVARPREDRPQGNSSSRGGFQRR